MYNISGNKKGYVLVLAIIITAIGAVMIGALLSYLGTSMTLANRGEERAVTYYAADAGVEEALWNVLYNGSFSAPYEDQLQINGNTVAVNVIEAPQIGEDVYKITSTATGNDGGRTTIESYVFPTTFDLSMFGDYGITSNGTIDIEPGSIINGDVLYVNGSVDEDSVNGTVTEWCPPPTPPCTEGDITCNGSDKVECTGEEWVVIEEASDYCPCDSGINWWPPPQDYIDYFLAQVDESTPYPDPSIDANYTSTIGPLYSEEDLLQIYSTLKDATLTLNGTVYVKGDLQIGQTSQDFNLDLNGHTIFVEGNLQIGGRTTLYGSGCFIAIGDVEFKPNLATGPDDFIFTMSIEGTTQFEPGGDYFGSVAGNVDVELKPGTTLTWVDPESVGFEFPQGKSGMAVLSYKITEQ